MPAITFQGENMFLSLILHISNQYAKPFQMILIWGNYQILTLKPMAQMNEKLLNSSIFEANNGTVFMYCLMFLFLSENSPHPTRDSLTSKSSLKAT